MNAVIRLDVPDWQIGQPVTVFFRDTMEKHGVCEQNQEPVDIEIEGGGNSWWYVCEECRGAVDTSDKFCRHCGRPFRKRKCAGCKDDCPQTGNFVCPNGKL